MTMLLTANCNKLHVLYTSLVLSFKVNGMRYQWAE
jgi:hypothetical protein